MGRPEISADTLRVTLLPADGEDAGKMNQLKHGLDRCGTPTQLGFLGLFQDFQRCVKEIALTTTFEVKSSSSIRKLDVGEYIEVIGDKRKDEKTGLERVRCRAMRDFAEGWATMKGNQGTNYLALSDSHRACRHNVPLEKEFTSGSEAIRHIAEGEIFERCGTGW